MMEDQPGEKEQYYFEFSLLGYAFLIVMHAEKLLDAALEGRRLSAEELREIAVDFDRMEMHMVYRMREQLKEDPDHLREFFDECGPFRVTQRDDLQGIMVESARDDEPAIP